MFAEAQVIQQGNSIHVQHGDDKGLFVEFSLEPLQDMESTKIEGRPIFRDVEFVTIRIVGDTKTVVKRPIKKEDDNQSPSDMNRWPRQYAAFKNQNSQVLEGTPITEWAPVGRALAMELKAMNIHTVEQLAEVSDANLKWMGARALQEKAKAYIASAKDGALVAKQAEEITDLKKQMEAMQNQLAGLGEEKKKRGKVDDVSGVDASGC